MTSSAAGSWSNGYLSVQSLLSKFVYSDSVRSRASALTSNALDAEELSSEQAKDAQPWDRLALLQRLRTFRSALFGCVQRVGSAASRVSAVAACLGLAWGAASSRVYPPRPVRR